MLKICLLAVVLLAPAACTRAPDGGFEEEGLLGDLARGACQGSEACAIEDPNAQIGRPCPAGTTREPWSDQCLPPSPSGRDYGG